MLLEIGYSTAYAGIPSPSDKYCLLLNIEPYAVRTTVAQRCICFQLHLLGY